MYKAKQRMKTLLLACFAALVSILFAVALWVTPTGKISASAEEPTETSFGEGTFLITTTYNGSTYYLPATTTSSAPTARLFTNLNDIAADHLWTVTGTVTASGDYYYIQNAEGNYLYTTTSNNGVRVGSTKGTWEYDEDANSLMFTSTTRFLGIYNAQDWRSYNSVAASNYKESSTSLKFYKINDSSSCDECNYSNGYTYTDNGNGTHIKKGTCAVCGTEATIADKESCDVDIWSDYTTENGQHTRSGQCKLCEATVTETDTCEVSTGEYVRVGNKHSKTGTCSICGDSTTVVEDCTLSYVNVSNENGTHNMTSTCSVCEQSATTENVGCTFGEGVLDGTTLTYTCEYCEYSYTEETTMYTVTYVVPNGFPTVESVEVADGYTTILPNAGDYQKYTFVGWVIEKLAEDTATAPEYLKEGDEYTVTADVTLYALYSYEKESVNAESWNLVTDATTLAVGKEIVIVASKSDVALSTTQNGNNRGQASVTKNTTANTVSFGNDVQIITLEEGTVANTFAFNVVDGYLYAAGGTGSNNYLKTQTNLTLTSSWNITIADDVATIKTADTTVARHTLKYNSSSKLFSCYASGQADVSIYMKSGGKATCYTTTVDVTCDHAYQESVTAPTCTDNGFTTYTCSICGNSYIANEVEATGHNYDESITQAATCTEAGVKTFTCSVCDDTYTGVIPALGHTFVDGKCSNCGESQPIKATLTFDDTAKRTTLTNDQQVWKENGITVTNNKGSGSDIIDSSKPVRFYKNSELIVAYPGMLIIEFYCNTASYATDLASAIEGAIVNDKVVTVTLAEAADTFAITLSAGQVRLNSIAVYRQEAHIDSATITIGEDITMNYKVTMSDVFAEAIMYFTVEEKTYEVSGEKVGERYVFSLEIPPHLMASNISAKLKLGEQILASRAAYSVKTYAENKLNAADSSDELKQLVIDMLHYGAAAQNYKGYNTENLATAGLTEEQKASASKAAPESTDFTLTKNGEIASYPAYFLGAGVYFDNVNKIYVKLSTTENVTLTINGVAVEVTGDTVYTDGILATGFAETYTFVLSCNGEEMQTLTYSVNAYVYAMKGKGNAMADLAIALYNYGESAKAYKA